MCLVPVVITVSQGAARAMLALARTDLEDRAGVIKDVLLASVDYRTRRPTDEALADYMADTLDLLASDEAALYRDLLDQVGPIDVEGVDVDAPADPAE